MSKSWILKHIAGLPGLFEVVTCDPESPMPRKDAMEKMALLDSKGWRGWVEHMATGKRAGQTQAEKSHQDALQKIRGNRKIPRGRIHKMYDD